MYQSQQFLPLEIKVANEVCRSRIIMDRNVIAGRLFAAALRAINDDNFPAVTLSVQELDVPDITHKLIAEACVIVLRSTINRVYLNSPDSRDIVIEGETLFRRYRYHRGKIDIVFNEYLKPFFTDLKEFYATINWFVFSKLQSFYSQRMYLILKSYESLGVAEIPTADLLKMIEAPKEMQSDFGAVKRDCIEKAKRDLKKALPFNYETVRAGRGGKVTAVKFYLGKKLNHLAKEKAQIQTSKRNYYQRKAEECFSRNGLAQKSCCKHMDQDAKTCKVCRVEFGTWAPLPPSRLLGLFPDPPA